MERVPSPTSHPHHELRAFYFSNPYSKYLGITHSGFVSQSCHNDFFMPQIHRALMSVTDKTGIADFARALDRLGIEILSTGGTHKALKQAGIQGLREVADVTGFPEMLDGRV